MAEQAVGLPPAHPGEDWPRRTPHVGEEPTLVLDGGRCIYAAWPPSAVCRACGMRREEGYAGPVPPRSDTITYPDPAIVFTCKGCARRQLDLGEQELSGHRCQRRCHGDVHEDIRYLAWAAFDTLDGDQRIARYACEYAARGWTLTDISPAYHLPAAAGEAWSFTFVPARQLWPLPTTGRR